MRNQRRAPLTVVLNHVTSDRDELGNTTEPATSDTITGATFEPQQILERVDNEGAPVVQPAAFNLPGVWAVDADDQIVHDGITWQVIGGGIVWLDRTKVAVKRTGRT